MLPKKYFSVIVIVIFAVISSNAQIVTSKKEAVKKGIYQKPLENNRDLAAEKRIEFVKAENHIDQLVAKDVKPAENKTVKTPAAKKTTVNDQDDNDILFTPAQNYLATQLINNAMQFVGVRYRSGGTSVAGMDCSGFVTAAFNIFDLKLPRSSIDMSRVGEKINPCDAKKGDLIFFRTHGRAINHVGMVIDVINDEIRFLHSSSSKGVMQSSTKEGYYKRAFAQVNKVLKD